jgi:SAM-dependent methyltransferase
VSNRAALRPRHSEFIPSKVVITPELLRSLQTEHGQAALSEAEALSPTEADFLSTVQQLSRRYAEPLAKAAVEQAILRRRAKGKFSRAPLMFFEREGLEQASSETVSLYRAGRVAGYPSVFDLGCGIGGDSLALAQGGPVNSVDRDRMRLLLLAANANALGLERDVRLVRADLTAPGWRFPPRTAAFFDPARRKAGRRVYAVARYDPPLDLASSWLSQLEGLAVKVSPGVDLQELRRYACEVEFISSGGELKEACLWFGSLRQGDRRATVLPGPHSLTASSEEASSIAPPRAYLYEPDPAVLRAGLVGELGARLNAFQIDPTIAYLTSDVVVDTPFARAYHVVDVLPSNLRALRAALRARGVGRLTLKKRGSAIDVEAYERRLHLQGEDEATLILTRAAGRKVAILVEAVRFST